MVPVYHLCHTKNEKLNLLGGDPIKNPNVKLRFPGGSLEIVEGGKYTDSGGEKRDYDAGVKISCVNKSGKISFTDFKLMVRLLQIPLLERPLWT